MTDALLLSTIQGDPTSKAFADAGNDAACAATVAPLLPKILVSNRVTERGLFDAFADPTDAETILQGLETLGATNPVLARVATWLKPDQGGLDFGNVVVREMLDQLAVTDASVFTPTRVSVLKALGEAIQPISPGDVSRVYLQFRPGGIVGGQ